MITFYLFLLIFLFEGAAILNQNIAFFLYSLLPVIYFLEKDGRKESIFFPLKIFLSYLSFIFFAFVSLWFSVDRINTVNHLFFYLAAFFIFLLGLNEREEIKKSFKKILIILSVIFCLLSLLPKNLFLPTALQLVFPLYANHNHLGDFLGLVLIWLLVDWFSKKNKRDLIGFLLFLPFFIFSFSRSAYVDFLLISGIISLRHPQVNKNSKKLVLGIILVVFLFFLFTQQELYQSKLIANFLSVISQNFSFKPRSLLSGRPEYFFQGIKGFLEKPFFGWGLGNYIYPSQKFVSENLQQVQSALNLPITLLAEVGLLGFLGFLIFVGFIIKKIDYQKEPFYILFFYLSLNFLTDYTYALYGLFLLWFLLASLSIKKEKEKRFIFYPLFSLAIIIFIFLKINGLILTQLGLVRFGFYLFPFDHQAYQGLIAQKINNGDINSAKKLADNYYKNSLMSFSTLSFLSNFYEDLGEKKQALFFAQKITDNNRFPPFDALKKTYWLKKEVEGKKSADNYFSKFFEDFKSVFLMSSSFENEVYNFCFHEDIIYCRYHAYFAPEKKGLEKTDKNDPYQAVYTLNNEGFNERFDYSVKKPKDVFRILVIGDGNAFGFLVNTQDNWVERLEDKINFPKIKKVEVINLAYHSFDLAYQVERFRKQGIKYHPDLVIWMNNNFSRINEIFLPLTEKYNWINQSKEELKKYQKEGKYFPSWDLARENYQKKVKEEKINVDGYQRRKINEFFDLYQGPVVFISLYEIPDFAKEELLSHHNVYLFNPQEFPENKNNYYKKVDAISPEGHQALAEMIFDFLKENKIIFLL